MHDSKFQDTVLSVAWALFRFFIREYIHFFGTSNKIILFHLKLVLFYSVYEHYIYFIFEQFFTVMLLSIISFILILLTRLKIVLYSCTQGSEVNFLILQSNFSAIQIGTMVYIALIHTCLGIRHSKLQWLPLSGTSSSHSKALLQLLLNFA